MPGGAPDSVEAKARDLEPCGEAHTWRGKTGIVEPSRYGRGMASDKEKVIVCIVPRMLAGLGT